MNKKSQRYKEEIIERKIRLEIPSAKKSYESYCKDEWKEKLDQLSSDALLLHLQRFQKNDNDYGRPIGNPFMEFELLDLLYGIKFNIKDIKEKTFSISIENYLLAKIIKPIAALSIPQYRKFELSQQLRFDIDEIFYNKIIRWSFWVYYIQNMETELLFDYAYNYVKYHRNVRYFRDDQTTKHSHDVMAKDGIMNEIFKVVRNVHYKEEKSKNHLLFYLLYLTIFEWLELYILYDNSELINCFKICEFEWSKKYINGWCTILWLYDILINTFNLLWLDWKPVYSKTKAWNKVLADIIEASVKATTFKYTVSWSSWLPMIWEVSFIHTDPKKYSEMKKYAGDYWWVMPMVWMWDKKILDWKKKLNYKKARKKDKNN